MNLRFIGVLLALALSAPSLADSPQQEIQHLLTAVGSSGCTFVRNGKQHHTAAEAESHLAMKYKRAGSRVKTAEVFIERLASKSSWTGKPYLIECAGQSMPSQEWLTGELEHYRATSKMATDQKPTKSQSSDPRL